MNVIYSYKVTKIQMFDPYKINVSFLSNIMLFESVVKIIKYNYILKQRFRPSMIIFIACTLPNVCIKT